MHIFIYFLIIPIHAVQLVTDWSSTHPYQVDHHS